MTKRIRRWLLSEQSKKPTAMPSNGSGHRLRFHPHAFQPVSVSVPTQGALFRIWKIWRANPSVTEFVENFGKANYDAGAHPCDRVEALLAHHIVSSLPSTAHVADALSEAVKKRLL
jgi:hypothetical protein